MKNRKLIASAVAAACVAMMTTACGDLVVKVEKKPKNVDLSALENFEALNLHDSQDFLKHLDGLKVVAVDMLIKELAKRDYRSEVRSAIRNYRKFLIERATKEVKVDDSFYASADECRQSGLSFNMHEANDFLGIILKTAVLAKLSEAQAPKINPGFTKEIAAIGQIILMELGLKIEGDIEVDDADGITKTKGTVTIALAAIDGEEIDEATKKADEIEIVTLAFDRALGENYVGTFAATIGIDHAIAADKTESLEAKIDVERAEVEKQFVHTIGFRLGVKDGAVNYARNLKFEQVDGDKHKLKITDTLKPGTADAESFTTVLDVKAGTQCKLNADGDGNKGDEGGFIPPKTDEKPVDQKPADEKPVDQKPADEKPVDQKPVDQKPVTDDDGEKPVVDDKPVNNNPGQNNPGQTPGQQP